MAIAMTLPSGGLSAFLRVTEPMALPDSESFSSLESYGTMPSTLSQDLLHEMAHLRTEANVVIIFFAGTENALSDNEVYEVCAFLAWMLLHAHHGR